MYPHLQGLDFGAESLWVLEWLADVTPRQQLDAHNKRRFGEGVMVGMLVIDCLLAARGSASPIDFGAAKSRAVERFAGIKRNFTIKNFDNHVWKPLRPVAHLWAAYLLRRRTTGQDPLTHHSYLEPLFEQAEAVLAEGERIQLGPTRYRLLDGGTAWRLIPAKAA